MRSLAPPGKTGRSRRIPPAGLRSGRRSLAGSLPSSSNPYSNRSFPKLRDKKHGVYHKEQIRNPPCGIEFAADRPIGNGHHPGAKRQYERNQGRRFPGRRWLAVQIQRRQSGCRHQHVERKKRPVPSDQNRVPVIGISPFGRDEAQCRRAEI